MSDQRGRHLQIRGRHRADTDSGNNTRGRHIEEGSTGFRAPRLRLTRLINSRFATVGSIALSLVLIASFAFAGVEDTGFEIDGNIKYDGTNPLKDLFDWDKTSGGISYPPAVHIEDPHSKSATDLNIFKPSGKFATPANWSIQPGTVGSAQSELTNIWAWAVAPGDVGPGAPAEAWLMLGMERTKKEGTFALDFELNQNSWDGSSGTLVRTPGDIAVGFELSGNPNDPQTDLKVLIVQYTPGDQPSLCEVTLGNGNKLQSVVSGFDPCPAYGSGTGWWYRFLDNAALLGDLGEATMNASALSDLGEFFSWNAQGNLDNAIGPFEFAEAAINLTELGLEPGCPGFGSVHAKSRASLAVGSDLKDLSGPRPLPVDCSIHGQKREDVDGDGDFNDADPGIGGWPISLYLDDPDKGTQGSFDAEDDLVATTTSATQAEVDADPNDDITAIGQYWFEGVADGDYFIVEADDPAWTHTTPNVIGPITINLANKVSEGNDFLNFELITKSGSKYVDDEGDGLIAGDSKYTGGWTINLYKDDGDGVLDAGDTLTTTTTDGSGDYAFTDLGPGTYFVCEATATGWIQTFPNTVAGEVIDTCDDLGNAEYGYKFTASSGQDETLNDFANFMPPSEGCTPGFWQGGVGAELWNVANDPDWDPYPGGNVTNPFTHGTSFNSFFTSHIDLDGLSMYTLVSSGGGPNDVQKAARMVVAAYLNAAYGLDFPYTTTAVANLWDDAVNGLISFGEVHSLLGAANNLGCPIGSGSGHLIPPFVIPIWRRGRHEENLEELDF